jgi:hypothetical protein
MSIIYVFRVHIDPISRCGVCFREARDTLLEAESTAHKVENSTDRFNLILGSLTVSFVVNAVVFTAVTQSRENKIVTYYSSYKIFADRARYNRCISILKHPPWKPSGVASLL